MTTFTNQSKSTANEFILMEDSAFLLLEDGAKIVNELVSYDAFRYSTSKNSASFSNQSRNTTSYVNINKS
jgi:hypothetical protein